MVEIHISELERLISKGRLDRYRPPSGDDFETIVTYVLNAALAESLVQGLSSLEIALRNSIHNAFSIHTGTEYWFQAILQPRDMKVVHDIWTALSNRHKTPPFPGKILADLSFGFWPPLFDSSYNQLWMNDHARLFKAVFPHLPTGLAPRDSITPKTIFERTDLCRKLRSRVMHYEPIVNGLTVLNLPPVPLSTLHRYMKEMLTWIDPRPATMLDFVDRFEDVNRHEEERLRARLKAHFDLT